MKSSLKIAVTYRLRTKIAYELALGLSGMGLRSGTEITVSFGIGNSRLGGFGGPELLEKGEFDLAFLNPSAASYAAFHGLEPYDRKFDIRALAVFPSLDKLVFAVRKDLGVASLAEIRERKIPLRLSVRIQGPNGTAEFAIRKVLGFYGWTLEDLENWGGHIDGVPTPENPKRIEGLERGAYDAVFDEGIDHWGEIARGRDMTFLSVEPGVLTRMERLGFRRAVICQSRSGGAPGDIAAVDFSGWPLFCRADFPQEDAYAIVEALDRRKDHIRLENGKLDMKSICKDTEEGPLCIPLHPGAELYYRRHGYLSG